MKIYNPVSKTYVNFGLPEFICALFLCFILSTWYNYVYFQAHLTLLQTTAIALGWVMGSIGCSLEGMPLVFVKIHNFILNSLFVVAGTSQIIQWCGFKILPLFNIG
jgi:hypothetical protein